MESMQKASSVIHALVVIIIGTIAFDLLFNLLTGGGNMEHMGGSGYITNNSSLDVLLGGILVLLVKLLMVVLVIALVVGIGMWIKNAFFKESNSQFFKSFTNDPILKTVGVITLAVLGIIIVFSLLGSLTSQGINGNFNISLSIAGLLNLLIKVLSFTLVISLILAVIAYLKKQFDAGAFNTLVQPSGQASSVNPTLQEVNVTSEKATTSAVHEGNENNSQ